MTLGGNFRLSCHKKSMRRRKLEEPDKTKNKGKPLALVTTALLVPMGVLRKVG